MSKTPSALILGGGLAGLVTALELAKRGVRPTVIEAGPKAGGRTSSWTTPEGLHVDTGLHVVPDHYHNFLEILAEIGAARLNWWSTHYHLRRHGNPMRCHYSDLKSPWHLLAPAVGMPIGAADRYRLWRAASRLKDLRQEDLEAFDDITYGEWHRQQRLQSPLLWDTANAASDAATFLDPDQASARAILSWSMYMSRSSRAADIGTWRGPMSESLIAPLVAAIEKHGGQVQTGTAVAGLEWNGSHVTGVRVCASKQTRPVYTRDGFVEVFPESERSLSADFYVSALNLPSLRRVLTPEQVDAAGLRDALGLDVVPAISVVIWLDRQIACSPPGAPIVTGYSMRDFTDLSAMWDQDPSRERDGKAVYQFVVARAEQYANIDDSALAERVFEDTKQVWPAARFARMEAHTVERIPAAMFAARPGAHRSRPDTCTNLENFFVAGDWTRHLRNASMEGATTSGRKAANAILRNLDGPLVAIHPPPELELGTRRTHRVDANVLTTSPSW